MLARCAAPMCLRQALACHYAPTPKHSRACVHAGGGVGGGGGARIRVRRRYTFYVYMPSLLPRTVSLHYTVFAQAVYVLPTQAGLNLWPTNNTVAVEQH